MAPPKDPKDYNNRSAGYLRKYLTEVGIPWKSSWLKSQYVQAMVQHEKDTHEAQNQHHRTDEEDPDGSQRMAAVDRLLAAHKPWNKMITRSFVIYHTQMLQRVAKAEERENKRNQEKTDTYKRDLAKHVEEPDKYPLPKFPKLEFIPQSTNGMYKDAEDTRGDLVAKRAMFREKSVAFEAEDEMFAYGSDFGVDDGESHLEKMSQNKRGKEYDSGVTNDVRKDLEYSYEDQHDNGITNDVEEDLEYGFGDDHQLGLDDDDGNEEYAPPDMNKRKADFVIDLPSPKRVERAGAIKKKPAGISSSEPIDLTDDIPDEETTNPQIPPRPTTSATSSTVTQSSSTTSSAITQSSSIAAPAYAAHPAISNTETHDVGTQNANENENGQVNEATTKNLPEDEDEDEDEDEEPEPPDLKPELLTPLTSVHPHTTKNFVFIAHRYLKPRGDRRADIERMVDRFNPYIVTVHSDGYYIRWKNFDKHRRSSAIKCAEYIQENSVRGEYRWDHFDAVWPEVVVDGETEDEWQGEAGEDAFVAMNFPDGC